MKRGVKVGVPVVLLVLLVGAFAFREWQAAGEAQRQKAQLLQDVTTAVQQEPVDSSELSRLVTRIQAMASAEADRELLMATARIERARGRYDNAWHRVMPFASGGGASTAELRFAAELQLQRNASGSKDAHGSETLRQVVASAEAAYAGSHDPDDLLLAWQAALRVRDPAETERLAAALQRDHADSPAAELAALAQTFDPQKPVAPLDELARRFPRPVLELELMRALGRIGSDAQAAADLLEPLLRQAPALLEVRAAAATTWHVLAFQSTDEAERTRRLVQRDAHLAWLADNAPPDDARHAAWIKLRAQR
jgi:hypothetical protein